MLKNSVWSWKWGSVIKENTHLTIITILNWRFYFHPGNEHTRHESSSTVSTFSSYFRLPKERWSISLDFTHSPHRMDLKGFHFCPETLTAMIVFGFVTKSLYVYFTSRLIRRTWIQLQKSFLIYSWLISRIIVFHIPNYCLSRPNNSYLGERFCAPVSSSHATICRTISSITGLVNRISNYRQMKWSIAFAKVLLVYS